MAEARFTRQHPRDSCWGCKTQVSSWSPDRGASGWGEATPRAGRHWGPSHSVWDITNVTLAHGTQARPFSAEWGVAVLQEGPRISNSTLRGAVGQRAEGSALR